MFLFLDLEIQSISNGDYDMKTKNGWLSKIMYDSGVADVVLYFCCYFLVRMSLSSKHVWVCDFVFAAVCSCCLLASVLKVLPSLQVSPTRCPPRLPHWTLGTARALSLVLCRGSAFLPGLEGTVFCWIRGPLHHHPQLHHPQPTTLQLMEQHFLLQVWFNFGLARFSVLSSWFRIVLKRRHYPKRWFGSR